MSLDCNDLSDLNQHYADLDRALALRPQCPQHHNSKQQKTEGLEVIQGEYCFRPLQLVGSSSRRTLVRKIRMRVTCKSCNRTLTIIALLLLQPPATCHASSGESVRSCSSGTIHPRGRSNTRCGHIAPSQKLCAGFTGFQRQADDRRHETVRVGQV